MNLHCVDLVAVLKHLAIPAFVLITFFGGMLFGYRAGITDTERRWADAVGRKGNL